MWIDLVDFGLSNWTRRITEVLFRGHKTAESSQVDMWLDQVDVWLKLCIQLTLGVMLE